MGSTLTHAWDLLCGTSILDNMCPSARTKVQSAAANRTRCAGSPLHWLGLAFGAVALYWLWGAFGELLMNAATGAISKDFMLVAGLAAVVIAQVVDGRDAESSSFFPARIILLAGVAFLRGELWILPLQAVVMSIIVYRSSVSAQFVDNRTPKANVLRCGLGVMALQGAQCWLQARSCGMLYDTLVNVCFGYMSACISDYCSTGLFGMRIGYTTCVGWTDGCGSLSNCITCSIS